MSEKRKPYKPVANIEALSMIEHVEIIAIHAHDSELSQDFQNTIRPHTRIVADYFEINEIQSIFLSTLITINLQTSSVDFAEIARFLNLSCISIAKYLPCIRVLIDRQMVNVTIEETRKRRRQTQLSTEEFCVNKDLYSALLRGERFIPSENKAVDVFDLLKIVGQKIRYKDEYQNEGEVYGELNAVLQQNEHIRFVSDLKMFNLDDPALILYLFLCTLFCDDPDEEAELARVINYVLPEIRDNMKIRKQFMNQEHPLQKHDLVELEKGSFRSDATIYLTDKSKDMILGENKEMFTRTKMTTNKQFQIIKAQDIIEKRLFYSEEEQKEIDFIVDVLQPENYKNMMQRLRDEGLPQGLCLLFFGEAGTSKTLLCYTIAKKTGRDIFNFQVSEAKSMFYGESQKLVKKAFNFYREMVEKSSLEPFILLNEADSILSKRKSDGVNQGVLQTENAIQTIILNEMETLKGIMIATTNLQNHFDDSFYRRFLIKKKFEKPNYEVRKQIWADKLPWLESNDLETLSKYEITGAIIENVQRKLVLQRALYGVEKQNLDQIVKYLEEENVNKRQERGRIGFLK